MILINGRRVLVPDSDLFVKANKTVQFKIDITDNCTFTLYITNQKHTTRTFELEKSVESKYTILSWKVPAEDIADFGLFNFQIKVAYPEGKAWFTNKDYLLVKEEKIYGDDAVNVEYKRGYKEGYEKGLADGKLGNYDDGYTAGKQDGIEEGYNNGYLKGKSDGYETGYDEGYQEGYSKGYEQGKAEGGEFIGVKYSDFDKEHHYYLPKTADARSLAKIMVDDNARKCVCANLFAGKSSAANNETFYYALETIYMPNNAIQLTNTFVGCVHLTTIIGDLTTVLHIGGAFDYCKSLTELPYMPNLEVFQNNAVRNCTGLTSITFYKVLKSWHTGALTGATNIETINLVDGWNTAVYAQHCEKLTQACLHDMCEKLADMTGQTPLVFKIGEKNIAKIDDEHIAMLQQKNIDYS